jgi:ribosomal protein S18 acetylase RimI-like enzyme
VEAGPTSSPFAFRDAEHGDGASLALLADAATRRLVSWLWDQSTAAGQPSFEVGRRIICEDTTSFNHLRHWRVATRDGQMVGGLNSYVLAQTPLPADPEVAAVIRPTAELKAVADGTWYVTVASVFAEARGQGVGQALLTEADRLAEAAGCDTVSLLVGSFNAGAHRLYTRLGFTEWERRPFVPFPGSDEPGEWILMRRALSR